MFFSMFRSNGVFYYCAESLERDYVFKAVLDFSLSDLRDE
jgi:hypothetical protein